jgi:hypothetical protein
MSRHRIAAALLALSVGAAVIAALLSSPPAFAAPTDPAPADSAVTVSGTGEFANLKVTVSQTKNLINQTVSVTWTGGKPTVPASDFGTNYLQIMQCWGDGPGSPDRTQCEYGGSDTQSSPSAGDFVRSRQVTGNSIDGKETLKPPAGSNDNVYVPFWAVGKTKPTSAASSDRNDFFDSLGTNEVPLARTHGDGTGAEVFEVQTVREAPGLGCGDPVTTGGTPTGGKCWLVIVPRGSTEVDGSARNGNGINRLNSSPLSASNWENHLAVPMEFLPVGHACPIGAPERRVIGHELAADALIRWQPALCAGGGALFSYTQLPDEVVRTKVFDGTSPGLALLTNPVPPDQAPPQGPLVYAPVGLSGLAIAFNIEHQPPGNAPPADLQLDGQRFLSMKLTPRLVAKLLTQSYGGSVPFAQDYLKKNPLGLTTDPEFLALNPDYQGFATYNQPPDALVQLNGSDVTSLLWSWVKADPDATAFLAGQADPFGMVLNPNNKGLALPTSTFPRNDQSCVDAIIGEGGTKGRVCTLDAHPFTNDMHDAGRAASRGDSQARTTVLGTDGTPVPKKVDRQDPGHRALLAVVDAATAARYGLPTASLRNAAGHFVPLDNGSLLAGEKAMKPSGVAGVLASDPGASDPAAYPLTALSYAVTVPSTLAAAAGKDYAAFLRYAAGPGQRPGIAPGQLPFGMVPLPDDLKARTVAAAARVEAQAGKTTGLPAQPTGAEPSAEGRAASTGGSGNAGIPGASSRTTGATAAGPPAKQPIDVAPGVVAAHPAGGPGPTAPSVAQQPVAGVRRTPSLPAPAVGALLMVILICGALAATSSPVMHFLGAAVRRRAGKEVMPTEQ